MPREAQRQFERLAQARGKPDLLAEASHILAMLNGLGRDAADSVNVSRGREPEARRKMVERLVALMRGHGVEPTRNRGGLLHRLAAEIITTESIGEEVGADLDKTIARVLDTIPEN
jgi:hypothetical protein